jgi:hypothetical protein
MQDIVPRAGEEVIDAEHVVPVPQQALAEKGSQEAGATRDESALSGHHVMLLLRL